MHSLTKQERQCLLHEAGFTVDIPPDVGLGLKALPWRKLRILRRHLATHAGIYTVVNVKMAKGVGAFISSERQQQSVAR